MKFFIKQNSTLPVLKFPLTDKLMEKYNITDEMLENIAVTFSMIDENGNYVIANKPADFFKKDDGSYEYLGESKYTLLYKFSKYDTNDSGFFEAEFKLDFLDNEAGCGKITLPNTKKIQVIISKSMTITTVI